jgi:DNA polymerase I-like protein with 3'-5' exonuclease and polymerase domains/uracil-DNA glycosylase
MKKLPLYPNRELTPLEDSIALELDPHCSKCALAGDCAPVSAVGYPPKGKNEDVLLVIVESPTANEYKDDIPYTSPMYSVVRASIDKYWDGVVVWDSATRCTNTYNKAKIKSAIDACRPHLKKTFEECSPKKILTIGPRSFKAVTGRVSKDYASLRRSYSFIQNSDKSLVEVYPIINPSIAVDNRIWRRTIEEDIEFALKNKPVFKPAWDTNYSLVETKKDALEAIKDLVDNVQFTFDCETAGVMFSKYFDIICISFCSQGTDEGYLFTYEALHDEDVKQELRSLFTTGKVLKGGHNVRYDIHSVEQFLGIKFAGTESDTQLKFSLLNAESLSGLETTQEFVAMGGGKSEMSKALTVAKSKIHKARKAAKENQQSLFDNAKQYAEEPLAKAVEYPDTSAETFAYGLADREILYRYCMRDTVSTNRLDDYTNWELAGTPMEYAWNEIVRPAVDSFKWIERWGFAVSRREISKFQQFTAKKLEEERIKCVKLGIDDPRNNNQVADFLFNKLKLRPPKQTAAGKNSVDKQSLELLNTQHKAVKPIREYRRIDAFYSKFAVPLPSHIRADGRIHPSFRLNGAASGRISCANPNLQQIPRGEDNEDRPEGKLIKSCFVASPGYVLVAIDYSQMELRVLTDLSRDSVMKGLFESGQDFHMGTAKLISSFWGIKPQDVTKDHRSQAKAFMFGLTYGMTDYGMADRLNCTVADAEKLRAAILGKFSASKRQMEQWVQEARQSGYTYTYWNGQKARRRPIFAIADRSPASKLRFTATNGAKNTPVQGSASDYCIVSAGKIIRNILETKMDAKVVVSVHDSIVAEVRESKVGEYVSMAQHAMEDYPAWVKLNVDVEVGYNWGSTENYATL